MKLKDRRSNFELLRIVSMFMIVFLHVGTFGILKFTPMLNDFNGALFYFLRFLSIVAVNCYILISGYFLVKSKFRLSKLINIILETSFYSTIIYTILVLLHIEKFSVMNLLVSIFPIFFNKYWFLTIYVLLYITSPILNIIIKNMTKKYFLTTILVLTLVICIWQFIYPINNIGINNGNSLLHFIFLYFIGAYIQLYGSFFRIESKKKYFALYIIGTIISTIIMILFFNSYVTRPFTYNSLLNVIMSYFLFMFFKEINISSSFINYISYYVLGVYLIHNNFFFRIHLWNDLVPISFIAKSNLMIFYSVLVTIIIFVLSLIISYCIKTLYDKVENYFSISLKIEQRIMEMHSYILKFLI